MPLKFVYAMVISHDSRYIYVAYDNVIVIFNSATDVRERTIENIHTSSISTMCLNRYSTTILTGSSDYTAKIIRLSDGEILKTFPIEGRIHTRSVWSRSNAFVFTFTGNMYSNEHNSIRQYDSESVALIRVYEGFGSHFMSCAISMDDAFLVAGDFRGNIAVFNTSDGVLVRRFNDTDSHVSSIQWMNNWAFVSYHLNGVCKLYVFPECTLLRTYNENSTISLGVSVWMSVAPDSRHFITSESDRRFRVWDIEGDVPLITSEDHVQFISVVSASPDGTYISSACIDGLVTRYDVNPPFISQIGSFNYFQSLMLLQRLRIAIPKHVMIITAKYTILK